MSDDANNRLMAFLFAIGAVVVAVLIFGAIGFAVHSDTVYPTDNAGLKHLHGDQCERPKDQATIVERQNAWSNLAYLFAGVLVLVRGRTWPGRFFGGNLVILAFMSGLYHATLSDGSPQVLDVAWVYAALFSLVLKYAWTYSQTDDLGRISWWQWAIVGAMQVGLFLVSILGFEKSQVTALLMLSVLAVPVIVVLLFLIVRATGQPAPWYWWVGMTLLLTFWGYLIRKEMGWDSNAVFPILVGNILVLLLLSLFDAMRRGDLNHLECPLWVELGLIGVITGVGFFLRLTDGYNDAAEPKLMCHPDSIFQAHAWWHILSAAALLLTYDLSTQLERRDGPWRPDRPALLPER